MRAGELGRGVDPSDPLVEYRAGEASTAEELELLLDRQGIADAELWHKGGPPVAATNDSLFFVDEGTVYRIDREHVTGLGQTHSADRSLMKWGVLLYLLALPMLFLQAIGPGVLIAVLMALAGGGLVTKGFLSKALLVQVDDDRIPPFVIEHRKWKRIRSRIRDWA